MKMRRSYTMRTRAESAEATRHRILEAAFDLLRTSFRSDIRLEDVAQRSGVTVQTVLRLYGSRAALLDEAIVQLLSEISSQVRAAEPGDIEGSISGLFTHYEQAGGLMIRSLADEGRPGMQEMQQLLEVGRSRHRDWVCTQFAPQLACCEGNEQAMLVDALICVTDVYTWKLLRRDLARSRSVAEATLSSMVKSLLEGW